MYSMKKKQRGQRRKLKQLVRAMDQWTPFTKTGEACEHFHVPSDWFIQHPKTYGKVKSAFRQAWIKKTEEMIAAKPEHLPFCKIVSCIISPELWSSQIIIFYDEEYYKDFGDREDGWCGMNEVVWYGEISDKWNKMVEE